jgi:hypothetical protein
VNRATFHPLVLDTLRAGDVGPSLPAKEDIPAWNRILDEIVKQHLTAIFYRTVRHLDARLFAPFFLGRLKAELCGERARNLLLWQELRSILEAFKQRGVACMPLRGPALSQQLYGDPTARPMGDLDLLVSHERLAETKTILNSLGFCEVDRRPGFAQEFSYTLELVKTERGGLLIVEPHWSIVYPPFLETFDMKRVWQRATTAHICGVDTFVPAPADLFLHLALHLIHRGDTAPLLWYYELDRFLELNRTAIDWKHVMDSAAGQEQLLLEVFDRLDDLVRSPIPPDVRFALSGTAARTAIDSGSRSLPFRLSKILLGESHVDGAESFALFFYIRGLRRKLRYAGGLLFPSTQFMRMEYGVSSSKSLIFCYVSRIGFLAREALKGVVGLVVFRWRLRRLAQ